MALELLVLVDNIVEAEVEVDNTGLGVVVAFDMVVKRPFPAHWARSMNVLEVNMGRFDPLYMVRHTGKCKHSAFNVTR